MKQLFVIDK